MIYLSLLALIVGLCAADCAAIVFPKYDSLACSPWQVRLLPGQRDVVFSMYGTPGEVETLRQLIAVMREQNLGNGFDPGPASRAASKPLFEQLATVGWPVMAYPGCADMQIKGGTCVLKPEDEEALSILDRAGVFCAVQLGEWGYY